MRFEEPNVRDHLRAKDSRRASVWIARLDSDNLIQALDHLGKLLGRTAAEPCSDALYRKRANLADFDPRVFR